MTFDEQGNDAPKVQYYWPNKMGRMMLLATLLGSIVSTLGLALAYGPDLPAGPTIILLAGGMYVISAVVTRTIARRRVRASVHTDGVRSKATG